MSVATRTRKRCWRCDITKPLDQFYRLRSSPDGRQNTCAACQREIVATVRSDPEYKARENAMQRSRGAALERLARAHPVEFRRLLSEERARIGLTS